jgi:uncharacterized membrane protein YdjX (TVP38/TMEM64 family)
VRSVIRASIVLAIFLAIPIVPFLILGESFEAEVTQWMKDESATAQQIKFWLISGVLATDIFLPIPASAVITYAGGVLGFWAATMSSWLGMTVGAFGGFGLAKLLGKPFAKRFAEPEDLERIEGVAARFGPVALLITRPLPILAEACVLLMGTTELKWRRFWLPIVASNLAIAMIYAVCGVGIKDQKTLVIATIGSGTVPLLLALAVRKWLLKTAQDKSETNQTG